MPAGETALPPRIVRAGLQLSLYRARIAAALWMAVASHGCGGPSATAPEFAAIAEAGTPSVVAGDSAGDASRPAPVPRRSIDLRPLGQFVHGTGLDASAAEIAAYDATSLRLFVVNVERRTVDVLDIHDPKQPRLATALDVGRYGRPTSVAVHDGLIAASVAPESRRERGVVLFFDPDGRQLGAVAVGHEPDMLTFSPDGRWLLVANEGEPDDDYSFDPDGSLSRIDVSSGIRGLSDTAVVTIGFEHFNDRRDELDESIRIFGPRASVSQDLEPEYIAIAPDSKTAWISCQENNCLAVVDIESASVTQLIGLGFKDHSIDGSGLDASDKDGAIRIRPWPVYGMYQPDGIACWSDGTNVWLATANDGDDRDYPGYSERARVQDLKLDPAVFPNEAELQRPEHLGRLRVSRALGDRDGDGDFDRLYSFGGRSFAIWTASGEPVFDSGDQFECLVAAQLPDLFNSDHAETAFDGRSDDKGPEPEGIEIGRIDASTYAFIGLERVGGIVVYDVTVPRAPVFETYVNPRVVTGGDDRSVPDLGPEGILFIASDESPTGRPLLIVSFEVSGTTRVFEITAAQGGSE